MVNVMHYEVIRKHEIEDAHLIAYLFKINGGRLFSAARSPDDVQLEVGDVLKHHKGNIWHDKESHRFKIEGNLVCSTLEEAERKYLEMMK